MTGVRAVSDGLIDLDEICVLEPGDYDAKTRVLSRRPGAAKAAKAATIEVDYDGFTPAAQQAFQRAVDIWETHIESEVTIRVDAAFTDTLETNTLGSAGPLRFWFAETDDGQQNIYPDALIDALVGDNITEIDENPNNDGEPEIVAVFNSEANWYFGPPDVPGPAPGEIDFTSVVLHELGHGLGFLGSMTIEGGEGYWGGTASDGTTVPLIYDRFPVDDDQEGTQLINTSVYPNPSDALADVLTSDHGFFDGDSTNIGALSGTGPIPPQLYLPPEWERGSSYSHLDEFMYGLGNPNSLMTPVIGRDEVIHSPGGITCGMFADMGWPMGPDCQALLDAEVVAFEVDASGDEVQMTWTETTNADADRYVIEGRYFDAPFQPIEEVSSRGPDDYEIVISREELEQLRGTEPGLPLAGTYAFRLRLVRPDGQERPVEAVETTIQLDEPAVVSAVYPNPFANQASVSLTLQSEQRVRVAVWNEIGQRVAVLYDQTHPANDPRPITFDVSRFRDIASGLYFFRVIGQDFSETRSAVFVR